MREEPQVHRHEVQQHHACQQPRQHIFVDSAQGEQRHAARRQQDHHERTPRIGLHHRRAVGGHRVGRRFGPLDIHAAVDVRLHVVGFEDAVECVGHFHDAFLAPEVEENSSGHGQQQAQPARDACRPCQCAHQPLTRNLLFPEPHQGQCPQQRHGPLHDDERHRDRAELVVTGQVFEREFGESHQVAAPCQQDHHDACGDDPPFVAPPGQRYAQRREEYRRGPEVGGTARVGLRAPVGGQLLRRAAQSVIVQHGGRLSVRRKCRGRLAAHEVGDQQVEGLGLAVAPRRGIVERETALRGFGRRGELRAAADGLFRMFGRVPQGREVRPYGQYARRGQRRRAQGKIAQASLLEGDDAFADPEGGHRYEEIVGDLRMVGADFERRRERRERRAAPDAASQRHPRASHHQRGVNQRPHLRDMPRTDNQQEIGRQPVGQRRDDSHPRIDAEDYQHQPHRDHREEEERRRGVHDLHDLSDGALHELGRVGDVYQVSRHPAEHAARPLGVFARRGAHVGDVLGHAFVLDDVVLGKHLAAELRGEVECTHHEEEHEGRCRGQQFCAYSVRKFHFTES